MMRPSYTEWTTKDCWTFVQMRVAGASRRQIADALDRSIFAIASHITEYNRHKRPKVCAPKPIPARQPQEPVIIAKEDVPKWYALGWRLIEFNSDLCLFEWRSSREPRWPQ